MKMLLLPFLFSLGIYTNSLHGEFVMDDSAAIVKNMDLRPNVTNISDIFRNDFWGTPIHTEDSHKSYRPLTVLTYRLNFWIHGLDTFGYHVINVFAHGAATFLFTLCAIDLIDRSTGIMAGIFFALHPIHTEAVSSVVGRAETLSACFFCLAYLVYSRTVVPSSSLAYSLVWQLCIVFPLSIISMLCKEGGLTVLGTCMVLDFISSRRNPQKIFWSHAAVRSLISSTFIVVTLISRSVLLTVTNFSPTFSDVDNYIHYSKDSSTKMRSYAYLHFMYVKQLVFPYQLSCDWSYEAFPLVESWTDIRLLCPFMMYVIAFLIIVNAYLHRNVPLMVSTLGMGILPFVPSSNLLFPVATVLGERLLYLPSMGFVLLLSMVISKLPFSSYGRWSIALVLAAVYSQKTWVRNQEWANALSLFESAIQVVPNSCKAQVCVAAALNDLGTEKDRRRALPYLEQAFRIKPDYAGAHFMKGTILRELGQYDQAALSFQATIKYSSEKEYKPDVLYLGVVNLGALMMHGELQNHSQFGPPQHQLLLAERAFKEALLLEPTRYAPNANVAEVYMRMSKVDKALIHYKTASKHREARADLFNNYAIAVYKQALEQNPKQYGMDAIDQVAALYLRAIQLDPDYVNPRRNLGKILYRQKQYEKADESFSHCVRLEPLDGRCWYDRALCAMRTNQWKAAVAHFERLFVKNVHVEMRTNEVKMDQARKNYETAKNQMTQ